MVITFDVGISKVKLIPFKYFPIRLKKGSSELLHPSCTALKTGLSSVF